MNCPRCMRRTPAFDPNKGEWVWECETCKKNDDGSL